jgi:hypothetical protein
MAKDGRALQWEIDGKYRCAIDFQLCPTEVSRYNLSVDDAFTFLSFDSMPRWNDVISFSEHSYRVTNVRRYPGHDEPIVKCELIACKLSVEQELARLEAAERCPDCNKYALDEQYMVHDALWKSANGCGLLCMPCLETRLGRQLTAGDFTDALMHEWNPLVKARRLKIDEPQTAPLSIRM